MKKRHNDNMSLNEALKEFVDANKLQKGLDKIDVQEAWKRLMGNGVNSYTTAVQLKNNTLYVKLSSSVLREELSYGKEKIINLLNEALGKPLISKLVLN
jgi:Dna[CI] antecedent, DciA